MKLDDKKTMQHYPLGKKIYSHKNVSTIGNVSIAGGRYYISSDMQPMFHAVDEDGSIYAFDSVETFEHYMKYLHGKIQPED